MPNCLGRHLFLAMAAFRCRARFRFRPSAAGSASLIYSAAKFVAITAIDGANAGDVSAEQEQIVTERFERHRQPWTHEELEKLKLLAKKGMALKAISKAMTRSEESIKDRAKLDGIGIAKLR